MADKKKNIGGFGPFTGQLDINIIKPQHVHFTSKAMKLIVDKYINSASHEQ